MTTSEGPTLAHGRYELVRPIGRGASGRVWLARDHRLGRDVAIKRIDIPGHLPEEERAVARERIRREARAAARIEHVGVASLFDVVSGEETVDLVMSYVDAPDLAELVAREGPLDDASAADLGLEVLDVLEAAHAHGVVHRDVKPSNVLVGRDGVRLTDFGIASLVDETAMTRTGTALGSPAYLAPEQAEGRAAAPTADLWGLGALLYHAITGRPPFDRGSPIATMHAVVHDPPDPLDDGHALAPVIRRLLTKDPAQRPGAGEVREELERLSTAARSATTAQVGVVATRRMPGGPVGPGPDATRRIEPGPGGAGDDDAPASPAEPTPHRKDEDVSEDRRGIGALLVAALLLAVVGGLAWALLAPGSGDGTDPGSTAQEAEPAAPGTTPSAPASTPTEAPEATATGEAPATPSPAPTPTDTLTSPAPSPTATDGTLGGATDPDGWERYEGETYTVAHPPGWTLRPASGNRVDLVDPDTGAYLRMDWTDDPHPDPAADWREQSTGFAARHDGYQEIRIEPVEYRDYDAALWEYTYTDGGARLHAYNLGLSTGERGYALNFQTPAALWDEMEGLFDGFTASFEPRP